MQVESALFFESVEQIYSRVFRTLNPRLAQPRVVLRFHKYANANSRVRLHEGQLQVDISDLLQSAPAPIQEALAAILISKLFRRIPDSGDLACYRSYLNRADFLHALHSVKQERGRKTCNGACGRAYHLDHIFEEVNHEYFRGLMPRPRLGWSVRPSRTTLGHYDPSHHTIVLSSLLDSEDAPRLIVKYVMFHEMLHLQHPVRHQGARRCVHTTEFKKAEREFANYADAKAALRKFVEAASR
ncbi:MAG TPA: SprT-like domain-containing protein [Bryobacteraceae bacterium]|nr:SprT-like domain-containing protein [Bryobacteraceae bacterium]